MVTRASTRRILLASILATTACSESGGSSPTTATPFSEVEVFTLPADAPAGARAQPGTTRITITAFDFIAPDGSRVAANALRGEVHYDIHAWIYSPTALAGGGFEYKFRTTDILSGRSGDHNISSVTIIPGYGHADERAFRGLSTPYQELLRLEIRRNYVVIAAAEIVLTYN